jgi:hypothetical protein
MNWPEGALRPKASRRRPGVKVPVAAPNWAEERASAPSRRSERPRTGGNWEARGRSAAASSATAGAGAPEDAAEPLVAVEAAPAADDADDGAAELELDDGVEDPHAASASASSGASAPAWADLMDLIMPRLPENRIEAPR